MQIKRNKDTESFLSRCRENLGKEELNSYLDHKVSRANERHIQRCLRKAGAREFGENEQSWPSLFLNTDEWESTPYHRSISLKEIHDDHFCYETMRMAGGRLFSLDSVQPDPDRELNDWMKLRAMDRDFDAAVLFQDDEMWMLDAPSEAVTNDPAAAKAKGNALTFGLGIGYFVFMALRNPDVKTVTVVEKSEEVLRMFSSCLLPQFPDRERITLIHGDALDYWNPDFLERYDSIYADIWQSSEDGLFRISDLLERYHPADSKTDFWIEDSCMVSLRTILFLHFEELLYHTKRQVSSEYLPLMQKTRRYFAKADKPAETSAQLKDFLYDRRTLRNILGETR